MAGSGQFSKRWEDLEFSDNYIFCKVMENKELCKQFLEILLHIKIDHLEKPISEKFVESNYTAKGVRFDVYVKDSDRVFDIEMQTGNYTDILLRARYYQGCMDIAETPRRTRYQDLKETFIIFICKNDPFDINSPSYTQQISFKEYPDFLYNDKSHFIVYNAGGYEKEKDKEVKAVLKFIYNSKADTSFTNKLDNSVREMKNSSNMEDEYMYFMDYVEDEKDDARKKGIKEGSENTKIANARKMIKLDKLSYEEISECTDLPLDKIKELAKEICVSVNK